MASSRLSRVPSPPNEVEAGFISSAYPPEPENTPPPIPPKADRRGRRKSAWRPSGPTPPPEPLPITPPSPPTDEDDHDTRHAPISPVSPVTLRGPVSPIEDDAPRDFESNFTYQAPIQSPEEIPRYDDLPTFAESQAQLGHTNPLLAHPTQPATGYAPPEKMPLDEPDLDRGSFEPPPPVPTCLPPPIPHGNSSRSLDPSSSSSSDPFAPSISTITTTVTGPATPQDGSASKGNWFSQLGHKTTNHFNNLAHKFGGTGFLPDTLENECQKAALILRTFCTQGIYADDPSESPTPVHQTSSGSSDQSSSSHSYQRRPSKALQSKALLTIPTKVIKRAVGLAIFTTFRAGFQFKGSTGSGILIARQHDGSWGGPSAIHLSSFGGGLIVAGIDVFDCVCVINTQDALAAFMDTRVSIGGEVAMVAGPWGGGGSVEWGTVRKDKKGKEAASPIDTAVPSPPTLEVNGEPARVDREINSQSSSGNKPKKLSPVFSYVKSRGFYAGFGYDGTIITERKSANADFYGFEVTCEQIMRGLVAPPESNVALQKLYEVLRGAEGEQPLRTSSDLAFAATTDSPDEDLSPVPDLPPPYPIDSLHPAEAYAPEKR